MIKRVAILNGRIIDPNRGIDAIKDLFLEDGVIVEQLLDHADEIIDAKGLWVVPGLIDAHVHLREPGFEYKETIATGLAAAAAGGFAWVMPMPNTNPVTDTVDVFKAIIDKANNLGGTKVLPVPAITTGRAGKELVDMEALVQVGATAFSDDGSGLEDDALMKRALKEAARLKVVIAQHSEVAKISAGGVVHKGTVARDLDLPGWDVAAEETMIARDIELVRQTGGALHVSHISTAKAIELVRKAKKEGLLVTAEVTPHHLHLTDELIRSGSTLAKVNPPLRPSIHVEACRAALADGTIDIVATDHAPHSTKDKEGGFKKAAFGMVGLEIAVPTLLSLVESNVLTPLRMIEAMSYAPAKIFKLAAGTLSPGAPANVTIINPTDSHKIDASLFKSKGKNTPFNNFKVPGRTVKTIIAGKII